MMNGEGKACEAVAAGRHVKCNATTMSRRKQSRKFYVGMGCTWYGHKEAEAV